MSVIWQPVLPQAETWEPKTEQNTQDILRGGQFNDRGQWDDTLYWDDTQIWQSQSKTPEIWTPAG